MNFQAPTPQPVHRAPDTADEVDLRAIASALSRKWRLGLLAASIVAALILTIFISQPVTYRARATVVFDTRGFDVVKFEDVTSNLDFTQDVIATEISIVKSRSMAERVVNRLDLTNHPAFAIDTAPRSFLSSLLDAINGAGDGVDVNSPEFRTTYAANSLMQNLRVTQEGSGYAFSIAFTARDAALAALIANGYANAYVEGQSSARVEAAMEASAKLADRLERLADDVRDSESAVVAYRKANGLTVAEGSLLDEKQITEASGELAAARAELAAVRARYATASSVAARAENLEGDLGSVLQSGVMDHLRAKLVDVQRALGDARVRYKASHPARLKLEAELVALRAALAEEAQRIVGALRHEYNIAKARVAELERRTASAESRLADSNAAQVELRDLERRAAAASAVYESFLARLDELEAQDGLGRPDARIVSAAIVPTTPYSPRLSVGALLAAAAGLAAGLLAIAVSELFAAGVRTADAAARLTQAFCVAVLPRRRGSAFGVMRKEIRRDAYRRGVSQLYAELVDRRDRRRCRSPPFEPSRPAASRAGAAYVAAGLARIAAMRGDRTLAVLPADFRGPLLTKTPPARTGDLLPIMDAGDKRPSILFLSDFRKLLSETDDVEALKRRLADRFDFVVIALPELGEWIAEDFGVRRLVGALDALVLAVGWRKTTPEEIASTLRLCERAGGCVSLCVLTEVDERSIGEVAPSAA